MSVSLDAAKKSEELESLARKYCRALDTQRRLLEARPYHSPDGLLEMYPKLLGFSMPESVALAHANRYKVLEEVTKAREELHEQLSSGS